MDSCLKRGDTVKALVRPTSDLTYLRSLRKVQLVYGDLTSADSARVATRRVDAVYHSAARVTDYGSRRQFHEANVLGTKYLLDAARDNGAERFVFVSSPSVVADENDQVNIDESYAYPKTFVNLYSETKALGEQVVLGANAEGFVTCAIRPRAVWGPRDKTGWLPRIVAKLATGKMPDISGGKTVMASLCYCQNAAEACVLAARSDRVGGKAYFVTDSEQTDVWGFSSILCELFGVPPIRRRISPGKLRLIVALIEMVWKLPVLAHRISPPLSRYSVGLLTQTGTFNTNAAKQDFGYRPLVDQKTGLGDLKRWVESIGGTEAFIRNFG